MRRRRRIFNIESNVLPVLVVSSLGKFPLLRLHPLGVPWIVVLQPSANPTTDRRVVAELFPFVVLASTVHRLLRILHAFRALTDTEGLLLVMLMMMTMVIGGDLPWSRENSKGGEGEGEPEMIFEILLLFLLPQICFLRRMFCV